VDFTFADFFKLNGSSSSWAVGASISSGAVNPTGSFSKNKGSEKGTTITNSGTLINAQDDVNITSGKTGKGLTTQMIETSTGTSKIVIGYTPNLKPSENTFYKPKFHYDDLYVRRAYEESASPRKLFKQHLRG
jgi:hypothetical protein